MYMQKNVGLHTLSSAFSYLKVAPSTGQQGGRGRGRGWEMREISTLLNN